MLELTTIEIKTLCLISATKLKKTRYGDMFMTIGYLGKNLITKQ